MSSVTAGNEPRYGRYAELLSRYATLAESRRTLLMLYAFCFVACAIPILTPRILPLLDYQNHLARMYLLAGGVNDPMLSTYYRVDWSVLGSMAMDLIVPPLVPLVGLEMAGRLFILATFVLLTGGTVFVNRALFRGRLSIAPFFSFLLLYNLIFIWGFTNYLFAVGLFLWVFGLWLRLRTRSPWLLMPLFGALSFGLIVAHLYAFCVYGLSVAIYELDAHVRAYRARWWAPSRALLVGAAQFILPVLLFWLLVDTSSQSDESGLYLLHMKLMGIQTLFHFYNRFVDLAAAVLFYCGLWLAVRRRWVDTPGFFTPMIGALTALYLIMPYQLFDSVYADYRLPIAGAFLALAMIQFRLPRGWMRTVAAGVLPVAMAAQMAFMMVTWARYDRLYADFMAAIDMIEPGSRLETAIAQPSPGYYLHTAPASFIGAYAVSRRHAFVTGIFARPIDTAPLALQPRFMPYQFEAAWHTVSYDSEVRDIASRPSDDFRNPLGPHALSMFDYLLVYREKVFPYPPPAMAKLIYRNGDIRLYDLRMKAAERPWIGANAAAKGPPTSAPQNTR